MARSRSLLWCLAALSGSPPTVAAQDAVLGGFAAPTSHGPNAVRHWTATARQGLNGGTVTNVKESLNVRRNPKPTHAPAPFILPADSVFASPPVPGPVGLPIAFNPALSPASNPALNPFESAANAVIASAAATNAAAANASITGGVNPTQQLARARNVGGLNASPFLAPYLPWASSLPYNGLPVPYSAPLIYDGALPNYIANLGLERPVPGIVPGNPYSLLTALLAAASLPPQTINTRVTNSLAQDSAGSLAKRASKLAAQATELANHSNAGGANLALPFGLDADTVAATEALTDLVERTIQTAMKNKTVQSFNSSNRRDANALPSRDLNNGLSPEEARQVQQWTEELARLENEWIQQSSAVGFVADDSSFQSDSDPQAVAGDAALSPLDAATAAPEGSAIEQDAASESRAAATAIGSPFARFNSLNTHEPKTKKLDNRSNSVSNTFVNITERPPQTQTVVLPLGSLPPATVTVVPQLPGNVFDKATIISPNGVTKLSGAADASEISVNASAETTDGQKTQYTHVRNGDVNLSARQTQRSKAVQPSAAAQGSLEAHKNRSNKMEDLRPLPFALQLVSRTLGI